MGEDVGRFADRVLILPFHVSCVLSSLVITSLVEEHVGRFAGRVLVLPFYVSCILSS